MKTKYNIVARIVAIILLALFMVGLCAGFLAGNADAAGTDKITRAQAVEMMYKFALEHGYPTQLADHEDFVYFDVHQYDKCYNAVRWAQWNEITNGTGPNTFSPYKTCTRAQVVTMLYRMAKFYGVNDTTLSGADCIFLDVPANSYYFDAVCWAQWNDITNGTGAQTFSPNKTCTEQQLAIMLTRLDKAI